MLAKFASRKFMLAIAAFVTAAVAGEWTVALGAVLAYIGAEGVIDLGAVRKQVVQVMADADEAYGDMIQMVDDEDEDVDTSIVAASPNIGFRVGGTSPSFFG